MPRWKKMILEAQELYDKGIIDKTEFKHRTTKAHNLRKQIEILWQEEYDKYLQVQQEFSTELKNIEELLFHSDPEYIQQGRILLTGLIGIEPPLVYHYLLMMKGQVILNLPKGKKGNSLIISQYLIEDFLEQEVCLPLYNEGVFDKIEWSGLSWMEYSELGEKQKQKVLARSKKMKPIPAGSFMMGALPRDERAEKQEKPRHQVEITRDFYVGQYPVSQGLWEAIMGSNPSEKRGANLPVDTVSWSDCIQFCNTLSKKEGKELVYSVSGKRVICNWSANGYRLLTESEWEYAARANQNILYAGSDKTKKVAWHFWNSGVKPHSVGLKKPNDFGLYDMSGNVSEWVWDWFGDYSEETMIDPTGPKTGSYRVHRGGSWDKHDLHLRVSNRDKGKPTDRYKYLGFRLGCSKSL